VSFVRSCIGGIDFSGPVATEKGCQCLIEALIATVEVLEPPELADSIRQLVTHLTVSPPQPVAEIPPTTRTSTVSG
jgi:hypothetical protein